MVKYYLYYRFTLQLYDVSMSHANAALNVRNNLLPCESRYDKTEESIILGLILNCIIFIQLSSSKLVDTSIVHLTRWETDVNGLSNSVVHKHNLRDHVNRLYNV